MDSDVSWLFMGITYSMVKQRPRSSPMKTGIGYLSGSFWKVGLKYRPPWKLVDVATLNQGDPVTSRTFMPSCAGWDQEPVLPGSAVGMEISEALAQAGRAPLALSCVSHPQPGGGAGGGMVTVTFPVGGPRSRETRGIVQMDTTRQAPVWGGSRWPQGHGPGS